MELFGLERLETEQFQAKPKQVAVIREQKSRAKYTEKSGRQEMAVSERDRQRETGIAG